MITSILAGIWSFVKLIYIGSLNISGICLILACYSAYTKITQEVEDISLPVEDWGEYIMSFIQVIFLVACPLLNTIIALYLVTNWRDFRDNIADKALVSYKKRLSKYNLENEDK